MSEAKRCLHCDEPVLAGEECQQPDMHQECAVRAILGSVAHIEKRCGCYVPGSIEGDPPQMTMREAARAAWTAWRLREARN
jgi:hypothetical protein